MRAYAIFAIEVQDDSCELHPEAATEPCAFVAYVDDNVWVDWDAAEDYFQHYPNRAEDWHNMNLQEQLEWLSQNAEKVHDWALSIKAKQLQSVTPHNPIGDGGNAAGYRR